MTIFKIYYSTSPLFHLQFAHARLGTSLLLGTPVHSSRSFRFCFHPRLTISVKCKSTFVRFLWGKWLASRARWIFIRTVLEQPRGTDQPTTSFSSTTDTLACGLDLDAWMSLLVAFSSNSAGHFLVDWCLDYRGMVPSRSLPIQGEIERGEGAHFVIWKEHRFHSIPPTRYLT